jgi:hypothetical protein
MGEGIMRRTAKTLIAGLAMLALVAGGASAQSGPLLNELRTDHTGTDVDEYVELAGPAGASLSGITLLVIGDTGATNTCGVVEIAQDLSAFSIQADGFFALRISTGTAALTGYDATVSGSIENSDNLTFMLVRGNTAAVGNDLDSAPEDGTFDSTPWSSILDSVAIFEGIPPNCTTDEHVYSSTVVGPDGTFSPGHIYRCPDGWHIGPFGSGTWPAGSTDTVGAANSCVVGVEPRQWGTVKELYR